MKNKLAIVAMSLLLVATSGCTSSVDPAEDHPLANPTGSNQNAQETHPAEGKPIGPVTDSGDPISQKPREQGGTKWADVQADQKSAFGAVKAYLEANSNSDVKKECEVLSPRIKNRIESTGESCEVANATSQVLINKDKLESISFSKKDTNNDGSVNIGIQTSDNIYEIEVLEQDGTWYVDPEKFRVA